MDIVTISDANLGLSAYPVRIVSIEEDDKGLLTRYGGGIGARRFDAGQQSLRSSNVAYKPNQAAARLRSIQPLIYEPPPALTNNIAQVWVGASGGSGGVADPNWGGAVCLGERRRHDLFPNRHDHAAAAARRAYRELPSASGWDTTDMLVGQSVESGGVLTGTSAASAQAGATLSLVDSELLPTGTPSLTGPNAYNLERPSARLRGTTPAAHASGAPFARLNSAVVSYDLPRLGSACSSISSSNRSTFSAPACRIFRLARSIPTRRRRRSIGPVTEALLIGDEPRFWRRHLGRVGGGQLGNGPTARQSISSSDLGNANS